MIKKTGRWYREKAALIDIMPTVLDLAEAEYPKEYQGNDIIPLTGVSLKPAFTGQSLDRSGPLYFEHENNASIYSGDWKLVGTGVSVPVGPIEKKWELYNIKEDRTELNDLASKYPEKGGELSRKWKEWADKAGVYPKPIKKK